MRKRTKTGLVFGQEGGSIGRLRRAGDDIANSAALNGKTNLYFVDDCVGFETT